MLNLKDGLYRVVTPYFVAGFVVKNGQIERIAPILKKKFSLKTLNPIFKNMAKYVCP